MAKVVGTQPAGGYRRVLEQQQQNSVDEPSRDLTPEFTINMNYLRDLRDPNRLDYTYLRNQVVSLFRRSGFEHDYVFDSTIREFERLSSESDAEGQTRGKAQAGVAGHARRTR